MKDPALCGPTRKWRHKWTFVPVPLVIMGVRGELNKRVSVSQVFLLRDAMRFKIGNTRGKGEKKGRKLVRPKAFPNGVRCHPQKENKTVLLCSCRISN